MSVLSYIPIIIIIFYFFFSVDGSILVLLNRRFPIAVNRLLANKINQNKIIENVNYLSLLIGLLLVDCIILLKIDLICMFLFSV